MSVQDRSPLQATNDWNDVQWQHYRHGIINDETSNNVMIDTEQFNPVSPAGLEHDEIAQLLYLKVDFFGYFERTSGGASNTEPGTLKGEFDLGINVSGEDFMGDNEGFITINDSIDRNDDGTFGGESANQFKHISEDGLLYSGTIHPDVPFNDTANGSGGGGGGISRDEEFVNYRERYGFGPVVDDDDAMTYRMMNKKDQTSYGAVINAQMTLGWRTGRQEGVRRDLGLPDT